MTSASVSSRRLLVLDDDPTGSQCVAGLEVAFDTDPAIAAHVLNKAAAGEGQASACFVLTNSRALDEADAVALNRGIVGGVVDALADPGGLHVVSRSDSTLRGHVIAEPNAIADALAERGIAVDAVVLCPAMIEAGRFTEDSVHYALVDGVKTRVEDTDFAKDATFGYSHSDLREFLEERSSGAVRAGDCLAITLADISRGVQHVAGILAQARERRWVVVDATEYAHMEVVAEAMAALEVEGRVFVSRCGPSFVRPLAGQSGARVLGEEDLRTVEGRGAHGLVVVGSHVGLTSQQLAVLQERSAAGAMGEFREIEVDVERLLEPGAREAYLAEVAERLRAGLAEAHCIVYTSRTLIKTDSKEESLAIARSVSDAVVSLVQAARAAKPAWVVAKGGITSHEVAAKGLGIRRARVAGQFYAGQISMFTATDAPIDVLGVPYVVFPGNVGGRDALASVVERLVAAQATPTEQEKLS